MSPPDFPAGEYVPETPVSPARQSELIAEIERLPGRVETLVAGASPELLDARYKNWTVRQIIHHLADSHANAYIRFRLTLTEDRPTIKPYDETRWAELPDARTAGIGLSLQMLSALHARWVLLLRSMSDAQFERSYIHPEYHKEFQLGEALGLYAHHCRHHAAQIEWVLRRAT